ncbi:MAG: hypothetical protein NTZ05_01925 [Chloroflexi bacterium]|nr:hypothetical protein [Chloroflexota bacterium]
MSDIVPATEYAFGNLYLARELDPARIQTLREDAINALISACIGAKVGTERKDLTIRPILPNTDLSLTNESWQTPTLTVNGWAQFVSKTISTPFCMVFYGVFNRSAAQLVSALRYRLGASGGGTTKMVLELEAMIGEMVQSAYHPPVVYVPGNTAYIDAYGLTGVTTQALGLMGFIGEPRGGIMTGGV